MEDQEVLEIRKKKKHLKRYRKNLACIRRLENKYETLVERIETIKTPTYSDMPRGGVPISKEELISDKIELEERIKRLKVKGRKLKADVLVEIDSLEDDKQAEVLEAFFIDCKSIEDIAEDMGYTDRRIYSIYKDAIYYLVFTNSTLNVQ